DAVELEGEGDGRDVGGQLDDAGAGLAGDELLLLEFLEFEGPVGASECGATGDEHLAACARTGRVVLDRRRGVVGLEPDDPGLLCCLLRAGTSPDDDAAVAADVGAGRLLVDGAGRQQEGRRDRAGGGEYSSAEGG